MLMMMHANDFKTIITMSCPPMQQPSPGILEAGNELSSHLDTCKLLALSGPRHPKDTRDVPHTCMLQSCCLEFAKELGTSDVIWH